MDNLHATFNRSFRIFSAMNSKDYDYLESVASTNLKINRDSDTMVSLINGKPSTASLFRDVNLDNLEYRGLLSSEAGSTELAFAIYHSDGHIEFYMHFVRVGNGWKFDSFYS